MELRHTAGPMVPPLHRLTDTPNSMWYVATSTLNTIKTIEVFHRPSSAHLTAQCQSYWTDSRKLISYSLIINQKFEYTPAECLLELKNLVFIRWITFENAGGKIWAISSQLIRIIMGTSPACLVCVQVSRRDASPYTEHLKTRSGFKCWVPTDCDTPPASHTYQKSHP